MPLPDGASISDRLHYRAKRRWAMNKDKRAEMFRRFKQANPEPRTELHYNSPFELLIAVILSAQATDVSVNKATAQLYPIANTPETILALGVKGLTPYIKTIGLFNAKARNVIETCRILCEQYQGEVPAERTALEALPGVGRKTANVVLNTAFGQLAMAVDTHIFRVSNRTGLAPGKNVLEVEHRLMRFVPQEYLLDAHHWLILHGRYTCLARTPRCPECLVADLCDFKSKTPVIPANAASAGKKTASKKTAGKKTAGKKTAGKKKAGKQTVAKKTAAKKKTGKKRAAGTASSKKAAATK